jgi:hypothetical protein
MYPDAIGGRLPGPAGVPLWQKKDAAPAPAPAKAAVATTMPPPTKDNDGRDVHEVTWPLFAASGSPQVKDVQQAPNLANCPVAAMLAALAATPTGQAQLKGMLSEATGSVTTDISGVPPSELANPPASAILKTSRYFTVKLPAGQVVVSDVLYTDDHDAGWTPFYMRDPKDQCLWASIVEKALAAQLGSYERIDAMGLSLNAFWEKVVGGKPRGFEVKADTPLAKIIEAASAGARVPTIGATRDTQADTSPVSGFHGYAILGMQKSSISLYDPAKAKHLLMSPADFRTAFQAVFYK